MICAECGKEMEFCNEVGFAFICFDCCQESEQEQHEEAEYERYISQEYERHIRRCLFRKRLHKKQHRLKKALNKQAEDGKKEMGA